MRVSFPRFFDMAARNRAENRERFSDAPSPITPTLPATSVRFATVAAINTWGSEDVGDSSVPLQRNRTYRGPGGEIDQILVGPRGVCALETKYLNGTVFVRGDTWEVDRYDNYGNRVESGRPIEDRRGRSPSEQLNGAVKPPERFLSKRGLVKRIGRVVVLTHDRSRVGRVERPTVDQIRTLEELNVDRLFSRRAPRRDRDWVGRVVQSIHRDHEFHRKRSNSSRRRRR